MIRRHLRPPLIAWLNVAAVLLGVLLTGVARSAEKARLTRPLWSRSAPTTWPGTSTTWPATPWRGGGAGTRGGRVAGDYLAEQYAKLRLRGGGNAAGEGGPGGFFQPFGTGCRNVLAVLPGSDPELTKQYVVVCAHYDHLGDGTHGRSLGQVGPIHPGADDNASGTAGVLELAHAMTLAGSLKRSLLLASWDAEEEGMLGSKHWLDHPTVPLDRLTVAVNLDMIGRLRGERLSVWGARGPATGLRRLVCEENEGSGLLLDFDWTLIANSDHHPFFQHGIPVLMLHTGLHEDYHRPGDTAAKINSQGMREVCRLLFAAVYDLANRPSGCSIEPRLGERRKRPADGWSSPNPWRPSWTARRCGWGSPGALTTPSPRRSSSSRWYPNRQRRGRACRWATASTRSPGGGLPTTTRLPAWRKACPSRSNCSSSGMGSFVW